MFSSTSLVPPRLPTQPSIQEIYGALANDIDRLDFVLADIRELVREDRALVVLTERREHLQRIAKSVGDEIPNVVVLHGGIKPKARHAAMTQLAEQPDNEPRLIHATGRYLGEGFDDPRLDTLLLTMPIAWKGTVVHYAGRLHRAPRRQARHPNLRLRRRRGAGAPPHVCEALAHVQRDGRHLRRRARIQSFSVSGCTQVVLVGAALATFAARTVYAPVFWFQPEDGEVMTSFWFSCCIEDPDGPGRRLAGHAEVSRRSFLLCDHAFRIRIELATNRAVSSTLIELCPRMAGVTDPLHDLSPQYPERWLSRWERWATDETGQPILEFDAEAHGEWCAQWTSPCPVGNPQRLRRALGFRERNVAELELRVPLSLSEPEGACQVIVNERDDQVYVRVVVRYEDEEDEDEGDADARRRSTTHTMSTVVASWSPPSVSRLKFVA